MKCGLLALDYDGTIAVDGALDPDDPGDAWSPEDLLLASVQACVLCTASCIVT